VLLQVVVRMVEEVEEVEEAGLGGPLVILPRRTRLSDQVHLPTTTQHHALILHLLRNTRDPQEARRVSGQV
jgi:hypothetical protein